MNSLKITIITGQHLVSNPRVWKEANALSQYGYNVSIYSTWYSKDYLISDKKLIVDSVLYLPSISFIKSKQSLFFLLYAKLFKKVANILFILFQLDSIFQIVYLPYYQLKKIKESKPDLYICHQEAGLLLGIKLLKAGYKVAFDFEDWYSEDYLKRDRPLKLLREAELTALQHGEYVTCPSHSMAALLKEKYQVVKPLQVIFNTFPAIIEKNKGENIIPNSFVWFSQVIGPDRGLENFLEAIQGLKTPIQIHLIGSSSLSFQTILLDLIKNTPHQIKFHSMVSHHQLMRMIQKFEVGLALETNCSLSRTYTLTNKILTYLQLNLNVIASDTIGQLELHTDFKESITYVSLNDPIVLARKLQDALLNKNERKLITIPYKYTWEAQQVKILSLVSNSIYA